MADLLYLRIISRLIKYVCLIGIVSHGTTVMAFTSLLGGVLATPTTYEVTISKIEFQDSSGSFVTFAEGSFLLDMASVTANQAVGTIPGTPPPPGTYTSMRITFSDTFGLTGSVPDAGAGQPAKTDTGNASNVVSGGISNIGTANTTGGAGTKQSVPVPTGAAITTALNNAEISRSGGNMQISSPVSFTITSDSSVMPNLKMDFDVINAMEFLTTGGGTAIVIPLPPDINFTIGP